jgi:GNAT superfamily N-acetyltransferase
MEVVNLNEHAQYIPELAWLHFEAWGYLRPNETLGERTARIAQMCLAPAMPTVLVALEAGHLLGSAILQAHDGLLADVHLTPWLAGVYVKAEYRSRGIAAILIDKIESLALQRGFTSLHLCTSTHESYYQQFGYQTVENRNALGEFIHIMAKPLR